MKYTLIESLAYMNEFHYLSKDTINDLKNIKHQLVSIDNNPDFVIVITNGNDFSLNLLNIRKINTRVINWMWDNHLAYLNNFKNTIYSDFYTTSHSYCRQYLDNIYSSYLGDTFSCVAQWSRDELNYSQILSRTYKDRLNKAYMNYTLYNFANRNVILEEVFDNILFDVKLLTPQKKREFFNLDACERYLDWCNHKCTIILPIDKDLSTRVFDALFCGMIVIIPEFVEDIDKAIPMSEQEKINLIKIKSYDKNELEKSVIKACQLYDESGLDGLMYRHNYIKNNHMISNRIDSILQYL